MGDGGLSHKVVLASDFDHLLRCTLTGLFIGDFDSRAERRGKTDLTKKLGMFIHIHSPSALRFFHINQRLTEELV
jgi:hypothetical protein